MAAECPHLPPPSRGLTDQAERASTCSVRGCTATQAELWMCITPDCGFTGCGRSAQQHAQAHELQTRHPAVMNRMTSMIWCYACDRELVEADSFSAQFNDTLAALRAVLQPKRPATGSSRRGGAAAALSAGAAGAAPSRSPQVALVNTKREPDVRTPMLAQYPATGGLTGLGNAGNTCFLNAGLQALSHVPALAVGMAEAGFASRGAGADTLPTAFKVLMQEMWYYQHVDRGRDARVEAVLDDAPVVVPSRVIRALRRANPLFEGYAQQDAHEALRTLLNDMHERMAVDMPMGLYTQQQPLPPPQQPVEAAAAPAGSPRAPLPFANPVYAASAAGGAAEAVSPSAVGVGPNPAADDAAAAVVAKLAEIGELASPGRSAKRIRLEDQDDSAGRESPQQQLLRTLAGADAGSAAPPGGDAGGGDDSRTGSTSGSSGGGRHHRGSLHGGPRSRSQHSHRAARSSAAAAGERGRSRDADDAAAAAAAPSSSGKARERDSDEDDADYEAAEQARHGRAGNSRPRRSGSRADDDAPPLDVSAVPWGANNRRWLFDGPYTGPETVQRSLVSDLFQGVCCSRVRCRACGTDSLVYDTFYDLSLPLPRHQHPVCRGADGSTHPPGAAGWAVPSVDELGTSSAAEFSEMPSVSAAAATGAVASNAMRVPPSGFAATANTAASSSLDEAAFVGAPPAAFKMAAVQVQVHPAPPPAPPAAGASLSPSNAASAAATPPAVGGAGALQRMFCSLWSKLGGGGGGGGGLGSLGALLGGGGPLGLGDCLYTFFDWEPLTGADQYMCEACGCKRDADKRLSIVSLPEVLCLHLKRFSYASQWGGAKNSAAVRFPLTGLDMEPFAAQGAHACAARLYVRAKEQQVGSRLNQLLLSLAAVTSPHPALSLGLGLTRGASSASLGSLAAVGSTAAGGSSSSSAVVVTVAAASTATVEGASTRRASGSGSSSAGLAKAVLAAAAAGGKAAASPGSPSAPPAPRRVVHTMSPETRALLLHRHSIATGATGVELVTAAAAAAAGTGLSQLVTPAASAPAARDAEAFWGDRDKSRSSSKRGGGGSGPGSRRAGAAGLPIGSLSSPVDSSGGVQSLAVSHQALFAAAAAAASAAWAGAASGCATPLSPAAAAADRGPVPVPAARRTSSVSPGGHARYDLVSAVQHLGALGGGHYIAHARHRHDGRWYTYDDSAVLPTDGGAVQGREAYLLFYARQRRTQPAQLPPRVADEPADFFVSMYWWARYSLLAAPGPVSSADVLCDHGALKAALAPDTETLTVALTRLQYEALAAAYGAAEAPLRDLSPCRECLYESRMLQERRDREKGRIVAVDTLSLPATAAEGDDEAHRWFLMSEWWLTRWRNFINNDGPSDNTGRGVLPPGPIDNARLLDRGGLPLPNLRSIVHYRGVNANVWRFLHGVYGGGPMLKRREIDMYEGLAGGTAAPRLLPGAASKDRGLP